MTQFNTTLTTAAPRKAAAPIAVRLMKSMRALKQRCAVWLAPAEVEAPDYFDVIEANAW